MVSIEFTEEERRTLDRERFVYPVSPHRSSFLDNLQGYSYHKSKKRTTRTARGIHIQGSVEQLPETILGVEAGGALVDGHYYDGEHLQRGGKLQRASQGVHEQAAAQSLPLRPLIDGQTPQKDRGRWMARELSRGFAGQMLNGD